jgi:hypothetical protein
MKAIDVPALFTCLAPVAGNIAALREEIVIFYGDGPFMARQLADLHPQPTLPEVVYPGDEEALAAATAFDIGFLVLGDDVDEDDLEALLHACSIETKILSQDGFLALALFGEDWHAEARAVEYGGDTRSRSLFAAKALLQQPGTSLPAIWPLVAGEEDDHGDVERGDVEIDETEADETCEDALSLPDLLPDYSHGGAERMPAGGDPRFRPMTRLREFYEYQLTDKTEAQRWQSLVAAVRGDGLRSVVEELAGLPRARKLQQDGRQRYHKAIRAWERDLARLRHRFHDGSFVWPSTEP